MPKIITSTVDRWPGTVTISDPLSYPQFLAVQDAVFEIQRLRDENETKLSQERIYYIYLPGLIDCVEEWQLKDFPEEVTVDTFPSTPGQASGELITVIISEIIALYTEAEEVPEE